MRALVCTGLWGTAWERYGERFAETFARRWPESVELVVYSDRDLPLPRGELRRLADIPGYLEFMARHGGDPVANGRLPGKAAVWKGGDLKHGYSWSHDAVKWAPQAFIPWAACRSGHAPDILCWLDGDTETLADVPEGWLDELIGDHDGAYLGRIDSHSEIGFWAVRPQRSPAAGLIAEFAAIYTSGEFLNLRESHSAFVWDEARRRDARLRMRNLTPQGSGHVFRASPLAPFLEHYKGGLKVK